MDVPTFSSPTRTRTPLLVWALRGNAVFCFFSGVVLLLGARPVAGFLGWPNSLALAITGGVLILYAIDLLWASSRPAWLRTVGLVAMALDLAWVTGSLVLVFGPWGFFTPGGRWVVLLVADVVAAFAALQVYGLWKRTA